MLIMPAVVTAYQGVQGRRVFTPFTTLKILTGRLTPARPDCTRTTPTIVTATTPDRARGSVLPPLRDPTVTDMRPEPIRLESRAMGRCKTASAILPAGPVPALTRPTRLAPWQTATGKTYILLRRTRWAMGRVSPEVCLSAATGWALRTSHGRRAS